MKINIKIDINNKTTNKKIITNNNKTNQTP